MRTTKLTETVLAAAKLKLIEDELNEKTEILEWFNGELYVICPASPVDVERLTRTTAAANAG